VAEGAWEGLVAAALVGTERKADPVPPAEGALGAALSGISVPEPERAVLSGLATAGLWRRAGRRPSPAAEIAPEPAGPETQPRCSSAAAEHLAVILGGTHKDLLEEWLAAAAVRGFRAPERLLPQLLDAGATSTAIREPLFRVLGERGRWLVAQHPMWRYASGSNLEFDLGAPDHASESWQTGSRDARAVLLRELRDRDPAAGRELLASTWKQERADDRATFLEVLETGLGREDEPFLEAALDDRSQTVRKSAVEVLSRLPGSAYQQRMWERVKGLVTLRKVLLSTSLKVALPAQCDAAMARDGVNPKPPDYGKKIGEKAYWLRQMLSCVPPSRWTEEWRLSPAQILELAAKSDSKELLLESWTAATGRFRDPDWAEAILQSQSARSLRGGVSSIQWLGPARRERLVMGLLQRHGAVLRPNASSPTIGLLLECQHPWSVEFSLAVLDSLRRSITDEPVPYPWPVRNALEQCGRWMSPTLAGEAENGWPTHLKGWESWERPVADLIATLHFRREMHAAFADASAPEVAFAADGQRTYRPPNGRDRQ
jgi:hypothetical protein